MTTKFDWGSHICAKDGVCRPYLAMFCNRSRKCWEIQDDPEEIKRIQKYIDENPNIVELK